MEESPFGFVLLSGSVIAGQGLSTVFRESVQSRTQGGLIKGSPGEALGGRRRNPRSIYIGFREHLEGQ